MPLDIKEIDRRGKVRFQLNDLITKLPIEQLDDVLAYATRANEIYELDKELAKLKEELGELEEEAKQDRVNEIKSEQGVGWI